MMPAADGVPTATADTTKSFRPSRAMDAALVQRSDENRLSVVAIVLRGLALAEGFHQIWCQELWLMPQSCERARPEVCRAAGLHRHRARWQVRGPARETTETELLEEQRAPAGISGAHHDEIFCQVRSDGSNLIHEFPFSDVD